MTSYENFRHASNRMSQKLFDSSHTNTSVINSSLSEDQVTLLNSTFQSVSLAAICLFAILGNFLVAYTLVRKEQLLLPSNRLVFNLTASNFVFSLLILPFVVASAAQQKWLFGIFWCNFTAFFTLVVGLASILTSAMIAVDRYYAIVKPLMYTMTITTSKSTAMLLWAWIQAFLCSFPPLFGWSKFRFVKTKSACSVEWQDDVYYTVFLLVFNVFVPFVVMIACYYFIFQVARTKCRKVHVGTVTDGGTEPQSSARQSKCFDSSKGQFRISRLSVPRKPSVVLISYNSLTKSVRTICIVIGMFVVTWIPYVVVALVEAFCNGTSCVASLYQVCATWLMYCSTIGYPIVYGLYNRSIRKEIQTCLCPPSSKAMKGLPRRNSRRLSFSGSLFEYSPFRTKNQSSRGSFDFGRASIDLGSIPSFRKNGVRRPSQDSGAIMTESDVDTDLSFLPAYWFGRHSASAKSRLQHFTAKFNMLRGRSSSLTTLEDQPFPILQIVDVTAVPNPAAMNSGQSSKTRSKLDTSESRDVRRSALQCFADIPTIPTVYERDRTLGPCEDTTRGEKLFISQNRKDLRGNSIDEGICHDCILQDL